MNSFSKFWFLYIEIPFLKCVFYPTKNIFLFILGFVKSVFRFISYVGMFFLLWVNCFLQGNFGNSRKLALMNLYSIIEEDRRKLQKQQDQETNQLFAEIDGLAIELQEIAKELGEKYPEEAEQLLQRSKTMKETNAKLKKNH